MLEKEPLIQLPEDIFRMLRDLISEYCGIYFDNDSKYLLERRLNRRVRVRNFGDFRDYYRFLLYDPRRDAELSEVVDILTVNETYFFREVGQLRAFIEEICPELRTINKDTRQIRIWSAGCSSGEEPYTIAMLLLEHRDLFPGWKIEIMGSDINQRVLQTARLGVYRKNSFRAIDERYLEKYFVPDGQGFAIRDDVRKLVTFSCLNLLDAFKARFLPRVDVIFCRNVLIYFNPDAKKKVIDTFYQRLTDGGYLLLGHAESLMNISTAFALKHLKNDLVYQKPKRLSMTLSDDGLLSMIWDR